MIQPVNQHVLIEPVPQDTFIASTSDKFQEIGTVVAFDSAINPIYFSVGDVVVDNKTKSKTEKLHVGDRVYFDAWLAAKYPKENGEFYWLVKWEDIRAVDYAKPEPIQE